MIILYESESLSQRILYFVHYLILLTLVPRYHIWSPQNTKDSMKHHNADPSTYPLAASNEVISQLPPHYIGIPELDCLADQGLAYCAKLQENAIPLGVSLFKGAIHGFIVFMPTTPLTTTAYERYEEFLRTAY